MNAHKEFKRASKIWKEKLSGRTLAEAEREEVIPPEEQIEA